MHIANSLFILKTADLLDAEVDIRWICGKNGEEGLVIRGSEIHPFAKPSFFFLSFSSSFFSFLFFSFLFLLISASASSSSDSVFSLALSLLTCVVLHLTSLGIPISAEEKFLFVEICTKLRYALLSPPPSVSGTDIHHAIDLIATEIGQMGKQGPPSSLPPPIEAASLCSNGQNNGVGRGNAEKKKGAEFAIQSEEFQEILRSLVDPMISVRIMGLVSLRRVILAAKEDAHSNIDENPILDLLFSHLEKEEEELAVQATILGVFSLETPFVFFISFHFECGYVYFLTFELFSFPFSPFLCISHLLCV